MGGGENGKYDWANAARGRSRVISDDDSGKLVHLAGLWHGNSHTNADLSHAGHKGPPRAYPQFLCTHGCCCTRRHWSAMGEMSPPL